VKQGMGASASAETGSRASTEPVARLGPTGFDPARVRVTAADFNGATWDGSPFSHVPPWLEASLRLGSITIKKDDRDYALWAVETPSGAQIAGPGDDIVCADGHLSVQKDAYLAIAMEAATADETPKSGSAGTAIARAVGIAQPPAAKGRSE
jgi:hypothetical protein